MLECEIAWTFLVFICECVCMCVCVCLFMCVCTMVRMCAQDATFFVLSPGVVILTSLDIFLFTFHFVPIYQCILGVVCEQKKWTSCEEAGSSWYVLHHLAATRKGPSEPSPLSYPLWLNESTGGRSSNLVKHSHRALRGTLWEFSLLFFCQ